MVNFFKILLISICVLQVSCSKDEKVIATIDNTNIKQQMVGLYKEGYKELQDGDALYAANKFKEAELIFPQSEWAPIASLMAAYAYYSEDYYFNAVDQLEDYLKRYPNHTNRDYAQYILAMCYYENIVDEKRDLEPLLNAKNKFELILAEYPNTDFALDAEYKLALIEDKLAGKEMFIARHYLKSKKWIPAINRFKKITEEYDQTIYVEEALHRLVEINYRIGLIDEAKKYASVLGYNYDSSDWYKASYKVFNKKYEYIEKINPKKIKQKDRKKIITRFKKKFLTLFK
jgi:outer membrane protein assembly factor BamD